MEKFADFLKRKTVSESLFAHVEEEDRNFIIYMNPTVTEIENLFKTITYTRGITKKDNIFLWDADQETHIATSTRIGNIDQQYAGYPDICFYLQATKRNPLELYLSNSSFTGRRKDDDPNHNMARLLQLPPMKKISHLISNVNYYSDVKLPEEPKPVLPLPIALKNSVAGWQRSDPYKWKDGATRVGD